MIGADSTPRNFKIRPDNAEIGPPWAAARDSHNGIPLFWAGSLIDDQTHGPIFLSPFP
jgi:hypothetical protein